MKRPAPFRSRIPALAALALALTHASVTRADPRDLDLGLLRQFLFEDAPLINMAEISRDPGLHARSVSQAPWSSSFMPAVMGYAGAPGVGQGVIEMLLSFPFGTGYGFFTRQRMPQLQGFRRYMRGGDLDTLAPAEKYDLITGLLGTTESLTYQLWQQAKQNHDLDGLTTWTGMCNGWGPASIIFKRPTQRIFVPSADGRFMVPFYPEDIKQLASTLFFNTTQVESELVPEKFGTLGKMPMVGKRCNRAKPRRDGSGFILDPECEDVLPHFWHVAIVNLIGKQDQAFVADINSGAPVSNYPIRGYRFGYFDPRTGRAGSFEASRVARADFARDPSAPHRSPRAASIVGIAMRVWHTDFRYSDHEVEDAPGRDGVDHFDLAYEIEMDAEGNAVGGQWRGEGKHPDFIWYPPKRGITRGEVALLPSAGTYNSTRVGYTGEFDQAATGEWDASAPVPAAWRDPARRATLVKVEILKPAASGAQAEAYSQIRPQPLGRIVYQLIDQASE